VNIELLAPQFDVAPLRQELESHPQLWGQYSWRTRDKSPHREATDIWVRYNALANFGPRFNEEHHAVWYPVCEQLPAARELALAVASQFDSTEMGGVLLTKVPAHRQIYPHRDLGWHALYYEKIAVQIAGNEHQAFCFDDACVSALPGQSYQFNNQATHWVKNDSEEDRVTLICCLRRVH
jgi:Aspartyl/Asparaginyl beta-hydroxylase